MVCKAVVAALSWQREGFPSLFLGFCTRPLTGCEVCLRIRGRNGHSYEVNFVRYFLSKDDTFELKQHSILIINIITLCLCTGYKKKSLYFFQNYKNSKGRWLEQNKAKLTVSVKNCFPFFPFPFLYMSFLSWIYEMVTFLSVFFPSISFFS